MTAGRLPSWYKPPDGYLWDPWFTSVGPIVHLFHLFQPVPKELSRQSEFGRDRPMIAHASWSLENGWARKAPAITYTGNSYDEQRIHTGCVVENKGSYCMLYSGSNRFVCLAESADLDNWVKAAENPVAYPDSSIYTDQPSALFRYCTTSPP
jgi:hypothetical protein